MKLFLLQSIALALLATPDAEALWRPLAGLRGAEMSEMAALGNECTDLGETAAELVVKDNWCTPGGFTGQTQSFFPPNCRQVAYSVCRGTIKDVADRWCPNKNMKTSDLNRLMGRCENQVDSMIGGGGSDPCDPDVIFKDEPPSQRSGYERSARRGTLKRDSPDVWKSTKQARNRCKKHVGPNECKNMGYCFAEEESEDYADA